MKPLQAWRRWFERVQRATASFGVKHNMVANLIGRAWTAVMSLVFVPLYIHFLGIESYGLIGLFVSITALLSVLDLGLGTTLTRELARLSAQPDSAQQSRDLVRTLELVYWGIAILIGIALGLLARPIAQYWITTRTIAASIVEQALIIMGLVIACEWPMALYAGGLVGLQRHSLLNGIRVLMATLEYGGAVLVLWLLAPTIQAFFVWQILVSAVQTLLMGVCLWALLPAAERATFRPQLFKALWRFSAGLAGISILVAILTQIDKLVLSKLLPLDLFGYYALAAALGGALNYLTSPLSSALFPKIAQLVAAELTDELATFYHKSCQLVSLVILPAAAIFALFAPELLPLWIRDPQIVANIHPLVSLFVLGTAVNATMVIPYSLQLAYGWTKLTLIQNLVSVFVLVPLLFVMVQAFGVIGAAVVWLVLNISYVVVMIPLMHRRLLPGEMWYWYRVDVGLPLLVCVGVGLAGRVWLSAPMSPFMQVAAIACTALFMVLTVAWVLPYIRAMLIRDSFSLRDRILAVLGR